MASIQSKIPSPHVERRLRRNSMRLSLKEGSFAIIMIALVEAFYIPYLNAMGATPAQIGLGASIPALMAALIQLCTPMALYKSGSRKKLAVITALVQAMCFIPFGLVCHIGGNWAVWAAISVFVISTMSGSLGQASFADWMAHIVPRKYRGKYFAQRSRILGCIQLAVAVCAAWFLDYLIGNIMLAFTIVWLACFAARICSGVLLKFMYESPRISPQENPKGSLLIFLKELFSTTFGKFTLATSLLSLGIGFAAPFFAVHMLNNLRFSYVQYTVINIAAIAAMIVFLGLWGRLIDRVGSVLPLRLCALLIVTVPLPWVIFENLWVLLLCQIIAGFAWAGFNLAAFVFYLNSSEPQIRVTRISYFNALSLCCFFVGSTLGGLLGPYLPVLTGHYLQTVFLVSFILRLGPALLFRRVQEKRYYGKLRPLERFFFDPTLVIRPGIARSIFRLPKRSV